MALLIQEGVNPGCSSRRVSGSLYLRSYRCGHIQNSAWSWAVGWGSWPGSRGIVEPSTVLSNFGAILAVTCFVTHYLKFCGLIQLPCIISYSFWAQKTKLVDQGTLGSVCLCFTMPEASARGLKAGELGSSKGLVMHMPGGWFWLKS